VRNLVDVARSEELSGEVAIRIRATDRKNGEKDKWIKGECRHFPFLFLFSLPFAHLSISPFRLFLSRSPIGNPFAAVVSHNVASHNVVGHSITNCKSENWKKQ
jgi:hypothetical protein